jgi:hypothetical protein
MKITKTQLKKIIKEELETIKEDGLAPKSDLKAKILAALEAEFGVGSVMTDTDIKASRDALEAALSEPLGPDTSGTDRFAQRIALNRKKFPRST